MPKKEKKGSEFDLDDELSLNADSENDELDLSDLDRNGSLLSVEFQKPKDIELEKNDKKGEPGKKSENLLNYAKSLLKKVKIKSAASGKADKPEKPTEKEKKVPKEKAKKDVQRIEAQFQVTELMVEELGNFGLDISVIQDIIEESRKSLENGDLEAAEVLIKNSQIFASNLWLEHRMNLLSTTVTFIDTFLLNQTDLELDISTANKYFTQAQEFLSKRDITLANKYLDNTIQNVTKSLNNTRKKKLKESFKLIKFWFKELKDVDVDLERYDKMRKDAKKAFEKMEFEKTEQYLRLLVNEASSEIQSCALDVDKKEDVLQSIQGIYDLEDFSTLEETISKAESMLIESEEKDKIQLQLNSLLMVYKTILDLENKGLDATKNKELFNRAKESFEKGDYAATETNIKKIMTQTKQMLGPATGAEEPEQKPEKISEKEDIKVKRQTKSVAKDILPEKLTPEMKELYDQIDAFKKDLNYIKSIQPTGEKIVNLDGMINKTEEAFNDNNIKEAKKLAEETKNVIDELTNTVLQVKAKDAIESSQSMILEASELGIKIDDANQAVKSAQGHFEKGEFQAAINDAVQSQQLIDTHREKHQNASDRLLKIKLSTKKIYKNKEKPPELDGLLKKAENILIEHEYKILQLLLDSISAKLKEAQKGEPLDMRLLVILGKTIDITLNVKETIKHLKSKNVDTSDIEKIYSNAKDALLKQNFSEAIDFCRDANNRVSEFQMGFEIEQIKADLPKLIEELNEIKSTGIDISSPNDKIKNLQGFIENNDLENAKSLRDEIYNDISTLKTQHRDKQEKEVTELLEKLIDDIDDAKKEKVKTNEAEDLLNYAKQRFKNKNFTEVYEIVSHARSVLEKAKQNRLGEKVEKEMYLALETLNALPPEHPKIAELGDLLENSKREYNENQLQSALDSLIQFFAISDEVTAEVEAAPAAEDELLETTTTTEEIVEPPSEPVTEEPISTIEPDIGGEIVTEPDKEQIEGQEIGLGDERELETTLEEKDKAPTGDKTGEGHIEQIDSKGHVEAIPDEKMYMEGGGEAEGEMEEKEIDIGVASEELSSKKRTFLDSSRAEELFKEAFGFTKKGMDALYDGEPEEITKPEEQLRVERKVPVQDRYEAAKREGELLLQLRAKKRGEEEQYKEPKKSYREAYPRDRDRDYLQEPGRGKKQRYSPVREPPYSEFETYPKDYKKATPKEYYSGYEGAARDGYQPYDDHEGGFKEERISKSMDRTETMYDAFLSEDRLPKRDRDERPYKPQEPISRKPSGPISSRAPPVGGRYSRKMQMQKAPPQELPYDREPKAIKELGYDEERAIGDMGREERRPPRGKRLDILKKNALKGLQDIQGTISSTYHFGASIEELEQLSEDARNAFEDGDYQEVLLYVDKTEEMSRRLKINYMDALVAEIHMTGENTEYLDYLIREAENAYNNDRYKVGDEICQRFLELTRELNLESIKSERATVYCRFCGSGIPRDSAFCTVCGKKLW